MFRFSQSTQAMRSSEIRELLKVAVQPNIISFAGGMPNNDLFPIEELDSIYANLSYEAKKVGMQYGPTTGYPPLLNSLKKYLGKKGLPVDSNELMITTGSMQAINLISKIFIDPGDEIIVEYPCFIGAVAAFNSYQAKLISVPIDDEGIDLEQLAAVLDQGSDRQKLLYITPYFHNPAGIIYSKERKSALMKLLEGRDIVLVEDDPYGELYFDEQDRDLTIPIKALGEPVPNCYMGTFSKIFGPGIRLGWLLAPPEVIEKCELAKQSMDACSPTFNQVLANEFLAQNKMEPYLVKIRAIYKRHRDTMLASLEKYMPEGITWTHPKGGFYVWVTCPEHVDTTDVLTEAIRNGAVFVIGKAFDPEARRNNSLRLSFSYPPEEKIEQGVKIVAQALKKFL